MSYFKVSFGVILLSLLAPLFANAELDIQFEVVARTGQTSIPMGKGVFTSLGYKPSIDANGNVCFRGGGSVDSNGKYQTGVYTLINGTLQKVVDRNTPLPNNKSLTFHGFGGEFGCSIDNGRVAFIAQPYSTTTSYGPAQGIYTNVGQPSANELVEIALAYPDGTTTWKYLTAPWVNSNQVAMKTKGPVTIPIWDSSTQSLNFLDPGVGYRFTTSTTISTSGSAAIYPRYGDSQSQLVVQKGNSHEILVTLNSTLTPNGNGVFTFLGSKPVVDRDGLDLAFRANYSVDQYNRNSLFKRTNGGNLVEVIDGQTIIPGAKGNLYFTDDLSLANKSIVFKGYDMGYAPPQPMGLYTDINDELSVIVTEGDTIEVDGQQLTILMPESEWGYRINMSSQALAYTSRGYEFVFYAILSSGEKAILRAVINPAANPPPPPANITPIADFSSSCSDLNCSFTNLSTDSDGSIVSANWNLGDGSSKSGNVINHTYAAAGTYTVTLTVTDDDGASDSASVQVTATEPVIPNNPPVASISPACDELSCVFTSTSTDSDGSIASINWNLGDGSSKSGNVINHTYAAAGTYTVTLTVTDDDGASDSASVQVTATEPPPPVDEPPTVSITSPSDGEIVSGHVTINASASDDNSVVSVKFFINNVEVYTDNFAPFSHTFDSAQYANGSLNLKAMAYDSTNQADQSSINVTVDNAPEPPADSEKPIVNITSPSDGAVLSGGTNLSLAASATDNVAVSYVRFYVNGSLICTDSSPSYVCSWKMPKAKGKSYRIQATATDSSGNRSSDVINISSSGSSNRGGGGSGGGNCKGKKCR